MIPLLQEPEALRLRPACLYSVTPAHRNSLDASSSSLLRRSTFIAFGVHQPLADLSAGRQVSLSCSHPSGSVNSGDILLISAQN